MHILAHYHQAVARRRWSLLLALLLGVMLLEPIFGAGLGVEMTTLVLLALIFIGTVQAADIPPPYQRSGHVIVGIWFVTSLLASLGIPTGGLLAIETTVLLAGALWQTFAFLVRKRVADKDALMGALFGYVLLALVWAVLYIHIERWRPGAFALAGDGNLVGQMIYFSLVTITTLGYGDILPVDPLARICAGLQAAVGTLYVAVLIGSIVGAFGTSGADRARPPAVSDDPASSDERPDP